MVTSPFISIVWCFRPYKPYIFWKLIIWWWQWPRRILTKRQIQRQRHTYTDKDKYKVLPRPNVCYIYQKQGVQGFEILYWLLKKYWTWQATHCALLEWLTSNNSKLPIIGAFPRGLPLETIVTIVITIENHCYRCHHPSLVWLSSPLSLVWLSSPLFPASVSISSQCIYHHWQHCHLCHHPVLNAVM